MAVTKDANNNNHRAVTIFTVKIWGFYFQDQKLIKNRKSSRLDYIDHINDIDVVFFSWINLIWIFKYWIHLWISQNESQVHWIELDIFLRISCNIKVEVTDSYVRDSKGYFSLNFGEKYDFSKFSKFCFDQNVQKLFLNHIRLPKIMFYKQIKKIENPTKFFLFVRKGLFYPKDILGNIWYFSGIFICS